MEHNEISHFSHHEHNLNHNYTQIPFKCNGCKEAGIGSNYNCTTCNHNLHVHCALPSPSICHPFYPKCTFQFLPTPPGSLPRYCNACEKDILGCVYHCHACGFDLHPCCAKLPTMLDDGEVKLYLCQKVRSSCHRCGRKGGGRGRSWSYRSICKEYNLHVACAKEMLVENWHEICYGGVYGNYGGSMNGQSWRVETQIPSLKGTLIKSCHKKSKGKLKKCCRLAGLAVQVVISAVLGDPTTLIVGVIGALLSK